ncbi:MAG: Ldh family oxidoreductase [Planctomycetaceae bacterium]
MQTPVPYPHDPAQEVLVPVEQLRQVIVAALVKKSMFQFDAEIVADRMLEADLRGIDGHGAVALPRYLGIMDAGNIDPRARVLTESETAAVAVLDGSRAMGQVAATKGMQLAMQKASEVGTGTVVIHHSLHFGAAAVYALLAARSGLIGFCASNPAGRGVAAPGTNYAAVSNAPLAWAIPTSDLDDPIVIDFACGAASWGKLRLLKEYGLPVPTGLIFDAAGEETDDPTQGRVLAPAGVQGFGLGLAMGLLAGGLSGGKLHHRKTGDFTTECSEHFLQAIDPRHFTDPDRFRARATEAREAIRSLSPVDPSIPVRVPGDRGRRESQARRDAGIPLHRSLLAELTAAMSKLKIACPWAPAN